MINRPADVVFTDDSLQYVRTSHDPIRLCSRLEFLVCPHRELTFIVDCPFSQFLQVLQVWRPDHNHEHPRYVALDGLAFPFWHEPGGQLLCNEPQVPQAVKTSTVFMPSSVESRANIHMLQASNHRSPMVWSLPSGLLLSQTPLYSSYVEAL
jgi:hypothetical protein